MIYLSNSAFGLRYKKQGVIVEEPLSTYVPYIFNNLEWKVWYPFFAGNSNMGYDFIGNNNATYASSEIPIDSQIMRKPTCFTINTPQLYSSETTESSGFHMRMPNIDISSSGGVFFSFWIETFGANTNRSAILDLGAIRVQLYTPNGNALFIRDHLDATYYLSIIRNVKTHIGFFVNTNIIKIYINTVLTASFNNITLPLPSSFSPTIGRAHPDNDPTWAFSSTRMAINDFRMYFGEPSQADVNKLYNLELYLRCHYTFEKYFENNVIYDAYKYYNGTMFGNCLSTLDKKTGNYSAFFSGDINNTVVSNYIRYNNNIDIDMSRFIGCSFSIWLKFSDVLQSLPSKVFDFFADNGATNLFLYNFSDSDKTLFKFGINTANTAWRFNMPINQWNHLVITIGASNALKIYVNNVLTINITYNSTILPSSKIDKGGVISKSLNTGENISQWNGHIDDFKIYNKVLTSDDINILFNE